MSDFWKAQARYDSEGCSYSIGLGCMVLPILIVIGLVIYVLSRG